MALGLTPDSPVVEPEPPSDATPALARARKRLAARVSAGREHMRGSVTIAGALTSDEIKAGIEEIDPSYYDRPVTRGDCEPGGINAARPCPWASCVHHLAVDVSYSGNLIVNQPDLEVWEMSETCVLDVADRGGLTLNEVGEILRLSRERIRQVEERGLRKIKDHAGDELGLPPETP